MVSIVDTCWGKRQILDDKYWHIVPSSGQFSVVFKNNVYFGKGALSTISAAILAEPEISNAQTPYSWTKRNDKKEKVFEEIRSKYFPNRPPRLKSIYVFDNYTYVEKAMNTWFSSEDKTVYECRVILESVIHRADTTWLNCPENQWESCAKNYWKGKMSKDPFPEVIVHGAIYFPDWNEWAEKA